MFTPLMTLFTTPGFTDEVIHLFSPPGSHAVRPRRGGRVPEDRDDVAVAGAGNDAAGRDSGRQDDRVRVVRGGIRSRALRHRCARPSPRQSSDRAHRARRGEGVSPGGAPTLLVDDRRLRRNIGLALTQRWVLAATRRFRPDFIFFSKGLGLTLETVATLVRDRPTVLWYQDPQWYRDAALPEVAHTIDVGRHVGTFFVTGFEREWRALGLNAKLLPSAADRGI